MYNAGDAVVYSSYGVCVITAIEDHDFSGENVEYYVLRPVSDNKNKFYVPTDNEALRAAYELTRLEGIIPALESAHILAVLPKLEFKLMELLMNNQGICLSTEDILTRVWGYETDADIGVVWVYLSYLRKRLTALGSDVEIRARRGVGYTLEVMT